MKKIVLLCALVFAFSAGAGAQSWKNMLGKVVNKVTDGASSDDTGILGNVLGTLLGNSVPLSNELIEGTWNYEGVACVLESENALTDIGGNVVTTKLEEKLDKYLGKVGVKKGTCTFTFSANDSCVFAFKGHEIPGTYKINAEEKKIDFSFMYDKLNIKTYVSYNVTDMNIVFDADKLLSLLKSATSVVSEKTSGLSASSAKVSTAASALSTMSTLLNSYEGMMLGLKLKK